MTEDELDRIAELHFDNDSEVIAQLRRDPEVAEYLDRLDLVVSLLRTIPAARVRGDGGDASLDRTQRAEKPPWDG
ncbi:MAG: hypothetical protein GX542_12305 [Rhodococcus sp.]|nr:hypothetical protein [Rhodococcus sp. (in: high G+C Gram-positive bacteria)]